MTKVMEKYQFKKKIKDKPLAGQGIKPEPEDPGNIKWSKEDAIRMVYDVAPTIYRKHRKWWTGTGYEEEDFVQDAAMHISDKYDERYLDLTAENLKRIIYALLDGYFVFNKSKLLRLAKRGLSLDVKPRPARKHDLSGEQYLDRVLSSELDPEELEVFKRSYEHGKRLLKELLKSIPNKVYQSRKYKYKLKYKGKKVRLSPRILADLFLNGKALSDVYEIFDIDVNDPKNYGRVKWLERKFRKVLNKLSEKVNEMAWDDRNDLKIYLYTIQEKIDQLPDILRKPSKVGADKGVAYTDLPASPGYKK